MLIPKKLRAFQQDLPPDHTGEAIDPITVEKTIPVLASVDITTHAQVGHDEVPLFKHGRQHHLVCLLDHIGENHFPSKAKK